MTANIILVIGNSRIPMTLEGTPFQIKKALEAFERNFNDKREMYIE